MKVTIIYYVFREDGVKETGYTVIGSEYWFQLQ